MENIELDAVLGKKISRDGKPYICVTIKLTEKLEKIVFLSPAEIECINLAYGNAGRNSAIKLNNKGE